MKAPTRTENGGRNTIKISFAHLLFFKTLAHLFIPNFVITPVVLHT